VTGVEAWLSSKFMVCFQFPLPSLPWNYTRRERPLGTRTDVDLKGPTSTLICLLGTRFPVNGMVVTKIAAHDTSTRRDLSKPVVDSLSPTTCLFHEPRCWHPDPPNTIDSSARDANAYSLAPCGLWSGVDLHLM
jgi:hypothetical protein